MQIASAGPSRCDVAVLVDEEVGVRDDDGTFLLERRTMEWHVVRALAKQHERVHVVAFDPDITPTIDELRRVNPRLVFNLTEWVRGNRRLDSAIAGVLDMMGLPYTGAAADAMQLARDKALAKQIVADAGLAVPPHALINGSLPSMDSVSFPAIVKPQFGDGSDEIHGRAFVRSERELVRRVEVIRRRTNETLLCEEFVPGRDVFVGLLGNEPRVMPPLELVVGRRGAGAPRFATFRVKNDPAYRTRWRIRYRPARLAPRVMHTLVEASRHIFHALKLRDYARIDYRVTPDDRVVFLEANPNPDLTPHTFGRNRCFAGMPYPDLISSIASSALERSMGSRH